MKLLIAILFVVPCADVAYGVDFDSEIMPLLTKSGCNSGACHGASAGRGGFRLSLLGADPESDYNTLVHELEGRRINSANPIASLIIAKPSGLMDHGGNVVLDEGSRGYERLLQWVRDGALRGKHRELVELEVAPKRFVAGSIPSAIPIRVMARFDGGSLEDVTPWATFTTSDPQSLEIQEDSDGAVAHLKRPGQHAIVVRFLNRVVPILLAAPYSDVPIDLSHVKLANYIDEEVLRALSELRIPVSPEAPDWLWLRRVTLDLTGRLPDPKTSESFGSQDPSSRRRDYVQSLVTSPAFGDYWTLLFSKWLRMHSLPNDREGVKAYADWLRLEIQHGTPWDRLAIQLITATGDSHVNGPANFARMANDARDQAELVGQFFLGSQIGCANCHNHPLDKWTQDDYHGLAAVFAKLDRGREVKLLSRGAVTNLRNNQPAIPRIPGVRNVSEDVDTRVAFAEWLIADRDRYFAKALVNRLWKSMMGRGLVEPYDDLRETNSPSHPELLTKLAEDFIANGYNMRHILLQIALSNTYARSHIALDANATDDRFYSRAYSRPLIPEVFLDAIADVTGVSIPFPSQAEAERAVHLIDPTSSVIALDVLGRCSRTKGCQDTHAIGGGLPAKLHLINGELLNARISASQGRLHQMISSGSVDESIIREFYMRTFGRLPTGPELQGWCVQVADTDSERRTHKLEDFLWSLLSSRAFVENY
jgi:Protein of unknown function (DUF1549)/Protein of unknown function (DUF1553)